VGQLDDGEVEASVGPSGFETTLGALGSIDTHAERWMSKRGSVDAFAPALQRVLGVLVDNGARLARSASTTAPHRGR
jgi:hypothetical protein